MLIEDVVDAADTEAYQVERVTMETILEDGHSWFLERLVYRDALEIHIVEGIRSAELQEIRVAGVDLGKGYSTELSEKSRHVLFIFEDVLSYKVTNESYTTRDEYEIRTKGVFCKYERSRYLDFIKSWTLIDSLRATAYTHFGLILEDDIVDVVAEKEPRIEQLALSSS